MFTEDLPERLSELDSGSPQRKAAETARGMRCDEGLESTNVDWGRAWASEKTPEHASDALDMPAAAPKRTLMEGSPA